MRGADPIALLAIAILAVLVPASIAAAAGAFGVPSNDDWVYVRAAETFHRGRVEMAGHYAAFVGQLLLVQPFLSLGGGDRTVFTWFGLGASLLGLVSAYAVARRFIGPGRAFLAAGLLMLFPGYLRESATFMTDGPAFALAMVSLLLGIVWLDGGRSGAWLVASIATGIGAVTIRELAIAAPLAVLLVAWGRRGWRSRGWLGLPTGALLAGALVPRFFYDEIAAAPGFAPDLSGMTALGIAPATATLAAGLLPVIAPLALARYRVWSGARVLAALVAVSLAVGASGSIILPNIWNPIGITGDSVLEGLRPSVIPPLLWSLSQQTAVLAGVLLAVLATERLDPRRVRHPAAWSVAALLRTARGFARRQDAALTAFVGLYAAELVAVSLVGHLYDRYLYPVVPVAAVLLVARLPAGRTGLTPFAATAAATIWLLLTTLALTLNSFAYDVARWRAGEAAVALGIPPERISAGYEWVGNHAPIQVLTTPAMNRGAGDPAALIGEERWWRDFRPCLFIANGRLDRHRTIEGVELVPEPRLETGYRRFLVLGPEERLYAYRAPDREGCSAP